MEPALASVEVHFWFRGSTVQNRLQNPVKTHSRLRFGWGVEAILGVGVTRESSTFTSPYNGGQSAPFYAIPEVIGNDSENSSVRIATAPSQRWITSEHRAFGRCKEKNKIKLRGDIACWAKC